MDRQNSLIEREPRYLAIDPSAISLTVEASEYADVEIDVELVDISKGGAKLKTHQQVPSGQQLSLTLNSDEIDGSLAVDATVCWSQLAGRAEWYLGCSFEPQIPQLVLGRLAQAGVFDRREDKRRQVSIESTAAWELTTDVSSACIVDLSPYGFCLTSSQPGKPGSRVMLRIKDDGAQQVTVTGRCRWQADTESGFTLGCEFSGPQEYAKLCRLEAELMPPEKQGLLRRLLGT